MNYRKQIKLALIALVLILCTQGKPAAAKAPLYSVPKNREQRKIFKKKYLSVTPPVSRY